MLGVFFSFVPPQCFLENCSSLTIYFKHFSDIFHGNILSLSLIVDSKLLRVKA